VHAHAATSPGSINRKTAKGFRNFGGAGDRAARAWGLPVGAPKA